MIAYLLARTGQAVLTLLVAITLVFLAMRTLPGHPLLAKFGQHPDAEQIAQIRREQGWDRPLPVQLAEFLYGLVTSGDLGNSLLRTHEDINQELWRRLTATIELTLAAMAFALPLGVGLGILGSVRPGGLADSICTAVSLVGVSVPVFFVGICLRAFFTEMPIGFRLPSYIVDFEPLTGFYLLDTWLRGRPELFFTALEHIFLPAMALSTIPGAYLARITRASMLEARRGDFVRTAAAKGASAPRIVLRHIFPVAAPPIVNITGFQVGLLLSGAVLTETVFDWPGLGKYVLDGIQQSDYTVVQAGALLIATVFVGVNWLLDVLHLWLDPRLRR